MTSVIHLCRGAYIAKRSSDTMLQSVAVRNRSYTPLFPVAAMLFPSLHSTLLDILLTASINNDRMHCKNGPAGIGGFSFSVHYLKCTILPASIISLVTTNIGRA